MLENVPGLENYELFEPFCTALECAGYAGKHVVVDARHFGVPQRRRRLIYMATLSDAIDFPEADATPKTVRQAFAGLGDAGHSGDAIHDLPENRSPRIARLIASIPKDGGSRSALDDTQKLECHKNTDGF